MTWRTVFLCLHAAVIASAQTVPQVLAAIDATVQYRETSVSPDGRYVTWTVNLHNSDGTASRSTEIWLGEVARGGAGAKRIDTAKNAASHSVVWSRDGRQLAFLSDAEKPGQLQLYVVAPGGGSPKRLTSVKGYLQAPQWSPDGSKIALLFTENSPRAAGPLEPAAKPSGVVEEHIYEQRLALVDIRTAGLTEVTPANMYVYQYDWSPDGAQFAYTAAKGIGDNNWWIAGLYTIAAVGGDPHLVHQPDLQIANPRFSPDGRQIAFISGLMSDESSTGGDIFAVPAGGGVAPHNLTPERRGSPAWLRWLPSGKILFEETVSGGSGIATLDPLTLASETLWKGDETLKGGDAPITASADGKVLATIRHSWSRAPEVWAGPVSEWTQFTHANDAVKPLWGKSESVRWRSDDFDEQGWMLYPVNYDPSKKYPLVVAVHGGPASARKPGWPTAFDATVFSSQGYFVFFPNPRGSFGAGEAYTRANVRDFGQGDLRDILLGLDAQLRVLPIDNARLGIAGWSYGGYMTMWAVTQTRRFHAAFAGAGISNWQSYYGQNLIDQWMIPYFGASVYDRPEVYAKSSPVNFVRNVRTPTLMAVGDSDAECPPPQSQEFWHALKTLGVKTELVVYKDEGHAIRKPENVRDVLSRMVAWFSDNLSEEAVKQQEAPRPARPGAPVRPQATPR